ncbi:calcium channel protein [Pseudomonas sp. WN033]|nr:calcium channel protein [Pseudomonas sp. WN033]
MLEQAVAHYRERGEEALPAFSRQGAFVTDKLYVFVLGLDGRMLASGGPSHQLVGRNVTEQLPPDLREAFESKVLGLEEADGVQQAEYRWRNWSEARDERKRVFFQRVGDRVLAVGFFIRRGSADEAIALLERAVEALERDPEGALAAINRHDLAYLQDDLYVYVVDRDTSRFVAHGYNKRMIGADFSSLVDAKGQPVGRPMMAAANDDAVARHAYLWINPVTRKVEPKETIFKRLGNYVVAVGYYLPAME